MFGCSAHPSEGPPMASRRSANSSLDADGLSGPAAHTTINPFDHEACRRTSPTGSVSRAAPSPARDGRSKSSMASSPSSTLSKSATTCSRSSPGSRRRLTSCSSVSLRSRVRMRREATGSALKRPSSAEVARPSATAHVAASSSKMAFNIGVATPLAPRGPDAVGQGQCPLCRV